MSTILITGANRGIGLALTRGYQASGQRVIAVCRHRSEALDELGVEVLSGIDVTRAEDLSRLHTAVADASITILINNAGVLGRTEFDRIEDQLDDYRQQFEVNALAPLRVTHALSDRLQSGSKVVIVTSRMGSMADNTSGGAFAYRMSKAAVNAAGVSLAHELKARGVAVVLLHPGYVRTDMTNHNGLIDADESAESLIQRIAALELDQTGSFWHANGEVLPW
ncbi:MAG: SDR family oxidoreductase [Pseudomonadota bacterium]